MKKKNENKKRFARVDRDALFQLHQFASYVTAKGLDALLRERQRAPQRPPSGQGVS